MKTTWACFALGCILAAAASAAEPGSSAERILQSTGVKGGLIVHLGCGDGKLTAALRINDSYLVHGLDAHAENVAAARKHIQALGLYGPVSIEQWMGKTLPYVDNLINLLVIADAKAKITDEEIRRVLAPRGAALWLDPKSKVQNQRFTKPRAARGLTSVHPKAYKL
jgi:ubiquinone/menaquinone biosynthesis C-methylase UbiE